MYEFNSQKQKEISKNCKIECTLKMSGYISDFCEVDIGPSSKKIKI